MLNRAALPRGFTLIEILITLAIVGIVLALGAPAFGAWIQNTQLRSGAESMLTGIKLARIEATKRNTTVRFQMMDASCGPSATGANWVVSVDDAAGRCDVADPEAAPRIIRVKASNDGTANAAYAMTPSTQSCIAFDSLGRVTRDPAVPACDIVVADDIVVAVTNPTGGACVAASGPMRCLRIIVTNPGGQARMCDPVASDERKC